MLTESSCSLHTARLPCTARLSLKPSLPSCLLQPLHEAALMPTKLRGDIPGKDGEKREMTEVKIMMRELDIETEMRLRERGIGNRDGDRDRETGERHRYGLILRIDSHSCGDSISTRAGSKQASIQSHWIQSDLQANSHLFGEGSLCGTKGSNYIGEPPPGLRASHSNSKYSVEMLILFIVPPTTPPKNLT